MASLKFRAKVRGTGGVRAGTSGSYTDLAADGYQTMVGAAKVYKDLWIPATQFWGLQPNGFANWQGGGTSITGSTSAAVVMEVYGLKGTGSPALLPVVAASVAENADARMSTTFFAPPDAATSGCSTVHLYWSTAAHDTTGSMEVWRLRYLYTGTSGSGAGAGVTGCALKATCCVTTGCGHIEVVTLGSMNAFSQASPFCVMEIGLENSNASAMASAPDENIIGVRVRYIANSLGAQV